MTMIERRVKLIVAGRVRLCEGRRLKHVAQTTVEALDKARLDRTKPSVGK